jgi:methylmalonyl-CoA mutase
MPQQPLFPEFPPASTQQWNEQIKADLKGASPETLQWQTPEGISIKPFYTKADVLAENLFDAEGNDWEIRQDFDASDVQQANLSALNALNGGVEALGFKVDADTDLSLLLKDILIEHISTHFISGDPIKTLRDFVTLAHEHGLDLNEIKGSMSFAGEPLNAVALFNTFSSSLPAFKLLTVTVPQDDNKVEALSAALTVGSEYLYQLTEAGVAIDDILPRVQFSLSIGTDFFREIATIRTLKLLWPLVVQGYGGALATQAYIQVQNVPDNAADANNNMLRHTTECMTGIIGGANSISINAAIAAEDKRELLERIARNTQLVLKHESKLDKVADVGAGSYYLEALTNELAEKVWERFKGVNNA